MDKVKKYSLKILLIVVGSIISAYGIDLAIHAGFGGATLAVLWQGVALKCHISIGMSSLLIAGIMIGFCMIYDIHQINVGTVLYQVVYGVFVDVFSGGVFYFDNKIINFFIMLVGICIFAFGTGLYSFADFGRGSYEALMFALVDKCKWKINIVRKALDISVVIIGVLLGGKFGICTICTIFLSGYIIQYTVEKLKRIMDK